MKLSLKLLLVFILIFSGSTPFFFENEVKASGLTLPTYPEATNNNIHYFVGLGYHDIWQRTNGEWTSDGYPNGPTNPIFDYTFNFPNRVIKSIKVEPFVRSSINSRITVNEDLNGDGRKDVEDIFYYSRYQQTRYSVFEEHMALENTFSATKAGSESGIGTSSVSGQVRVNGTLNATNPERIPPGPDKDPSLLGLRHYFPVFYTIELEPEGGKAEIRHFTTTGQSLNGIAGFKDETKELIKGQNYTFSHTQGTSKYVYKGHKKSTVSLPSGGEIIAGDPYALTPYDGSFPVYYIIYYYEVQGDIPPPPDGDSGCQEPKEVPLRYEHELDVEVTRLDARTVDKDTNTITDVYVSRDNFSNSRNQAKQEFQTYINETEAMKTDCESKKAQYESEKAQAESEKASAESELSSAQSALASCQSTPPDEDGNTPDCSSYSSAISSAESSIAEAEAKIAEKEAQIADCERFIALYIEKIQEANNELQYIQSNESTYNTISPTVILRYNNSEVARITVSLREGERSKRYQFPSWSVANDGEIMAQINDIGPYNEFVYQPLQSRSEKSLGYNSRVGNVLYSNSSSNNWKDTPIYIATYATAACPNPAAFFSASTIEGVVRTVNDNGNKREIKERVTSTFSKLPRSEMRAGFGFDYLIQTHYQNFDTEPDPATATGTKSVESYFPTFIDFLPYTRGGAKISINKNGQATYADEGYLVAQETPNPGVARNETRVWNLPPVAVEEFSGNTFSIRNNDYLYHSQRNHNENLLTTDQNGQPLTKWYVDFMQPDGYYEFKVRTYDAGVNHLNTCQTGRVLVQGSFIGDPNGNDDFVRRTISPNNPFPGGVGWNWIGHVNRLTNLQSWWNNAPNRDPYTAPSNYAACYILDEEAMKQVKAYNKRYGIEVDSYIPNGGRFWDEVGSFIKACPRVP